MKYKILGNESFKDLEKELNAFEKDYIVIRNLHYSVTDEFFSVLIEYESMS